MATSIYTPQRLYLIQVATLPPTGAPVPCYLIQTTDGKNILIDSGLPANFRLPEGRPIPEFGKSVVEQLAILGLKPKDIDMLICTHFDVDHAGGHDLFKNAELVVQRQHYDLARNGYSRFASIRSHWDHPELRYRTVDGNTELLPGLELIETSGHVPGHQSVLVRLPETGPVLLAIDAVPVQHAFTAERKAGPLDVDEEQLRASTRKLLDLIEREHVGLVIFGHDGKQWPTLKKAPEYYA